MKTDHYYVQVFLTPRGKIYVDYSLRNKAGKVNFKRVFANKIEASPETNGWEIKKEIGFLNFYIQKNGMEIEDTMPIEMLYSVKMESPNLRISETYFFAAVKKFSSSVRNDNFILMDLEDFLWDEEIDWADKSAIEVFFNGDTPIKGNE